MAEHEGTGRRIVAAVITLIVPGAGHVYRGRLRRGVAWFAALALLYVALPWSGPLGFLLVWGAHFLGVPVDAAVCRRGPPLPNKVQLGAAATMIVVMASMVLTIRLYLVEAFKVPGASMCPTLLIGDLFYVNKLAGPSLGAVIVFRHPHQPRDFVKRVVAVAGDHVAVNGGVLYRNGAAVPRGPSAPCRVDDRDEMTGQWQPLEGVCAEETLGGHHFTVMLNVDGPSEALDFPGANGDRPPSFYAGGSRRPPPLEVTAAGDYVVPAGHVFVLGDSRDNSNDSRGWGPVPVGNVRGTAMYVWWSRGPDGVRWGRLGHSIE